MSYTEDLKSKSWRVAITSTLIQRGVRQGDTVSPALFAAVLESVFRRLDWEQKGINVNGSRLSNFRYADDIVLMSRSAQELQEMLQSMSAECSTVGMKVNQKKTFALTNRRESPLQVDGERESASITVDVVASSVGRSRWPARMSNPGELTASRCSNPA